MSPGFKFRYDTVLKHRKIIEEREAREFAKLQNKYESECQKLDSLSTKYSNTQAELGGKKRKGIDIKELKAYYVYLDALKSDIASQRNNVEKAFALLEEQRQKLISAQKNKKIMDKLKEKKYNDFKEDERKEDIKIIDDINTVAAAHKINK